MARRVVPPRRQALGSATFTPWRVITRAGEHPITDLPPWDYATDLDLTCQVVVDPDAMAARCGLAVDRGAEFAIVSAVECRDTLWRATEIVPIVSGRVTVRIKVPQGVAARAIRLTRQVIVSAAGADPEPLAPSRGHVVDGRDDVTNITLEGEGGRFPTVAVSFGDMGLPDAPWHLSLTYDEPSDLFAGSVQLMLNVDHPAVAALTDPAADADETAALRARLSFDVARQLIMHAVRDTRIGRGSRWDPESVGGTLDALCARTTRASATGCRAAHEQNQDQFETELKADLGAPA